MKRFYKSIHKHFNGIINFVESKVTNGLLEGMNNKIHLSKGQLEDIDTMIILSEGFSLLSDYLRLS